MFSISATTIDAETLKQNMTDRRAGALVTFEGWVRDHNEGQKVLTLEYEAYEALCATEAKQILQEANRCALRSSNWHTGNRRDGSLGRCFLGTPRRRI
jgi:molybdopterin synthase catalytic subunit